MVIEPSKNPVLNPIERYQTVGLPMGGSITKHGGAREIVTKMNIKIFLKSKI